MALFVVATPIGNPADFSTRALEVLRSAELVIGEDMKPLRQILKAAGVQAPAVDQLNEHSDARDLVHLVAECASKRVALVSDCGTPGFCDPGADLVRLCVERGVEVRPVPGPSSLMTLLSVCGWRVDQFLFYGFLPAKNEARQAALRELKGERRAVIVMETPYRVGTLFADLLEHFPENHCVVGLDLTSERERVLRGRGKDIGKLAGSDEGEPIALILPKSK